VIARNIDRTCPYADDPVLVAAVRRLENLGGDLAESFTVINGMLADYDLLDPR